jgi:hypothetical protein
MCNFVNLFRRLLCIFGACPKKGRPVLAERPDRRRIAGTAASAAAKIRAAGPAGKSGQKAFRLWGSVVKK